jgi:hypothetical protein
MNLLPLPRTIRIVMLNEPYHVWTKLLKSHQQQGTLEGPERINGYSVGCEIVLRTPTMSLSVMGSQTARENTGQFYMPSR